MTRAPEICLVVFVAAVVVFLVLHARSSTPPISSEPSVSAPATSPAVSTYTQDRAVPGN